MQLPVGEFEKAFGLTVWDVFQTEPAQYWVLKRDSEWRSPTTRFIARFRTQKFRAVSAPGQRPGCCSRSSAQRSIRATQHLGDMVRPLPQGNADA